MPIQYYKDDIQGPTKTRSLYTDQFVALLTRVIARLTQFSCNTETHTLTHKFINNCL